MKKKRNIIKNIIGNKNHYIHAKLIGYFWYDKSKLLTQEKIDNPRLRIVNYIDIVKKINGNNHSKEIRAENIMKYSDNILSDSIEKLIKTKTVEKKGMTLLINCENRTKDLTNNECLILKKYTILHYLRSKNMVIKFLQNGMSEVDALKNFNKQLLKKHQSIKKKINNYNVFIMNVHNENMFLSEMPVVYMKVEECNIFASYLRNNLSLLLDLLLDEYKDNKSTFFNILQIENEIQCLNSNIIKIQKNDGLVYGINNSCQKNIDYIICKFVSFVYDSFVFMYHPSKFLFITPNPGVPEHDKIFIQLFGNFIANHTLLNTSQFIVYTDKSHESIILNTLKNRKINKYTLLDLEI